MHLCINLYFFIYFLIHLYFYPSEKAIDCQNTNRPIAICSDGLTGYLYPNSNMLFI